MTLDQLIDLILQARSLEKLQESLRSHLIAELASHSPQVPPLPLELPRNVTQELQQSAELQELVQEQLAKV